MPDSGSFAPRVRIAFLEGLRGSVTGNELTVML
ncbi:MAG: hypothetical protein KatS3mg114_1439 [Planctomycetaceae bacterium]|nr:MAG: hypothetical protein KatS3mg114_1439 [Planctomycetaceae bacterium]